MIAVTTGCDDVGRIEPAAQADLEHRDVDAGAAEQLERDGGRHFEERRVRLQHALGQQLLDRPRERRRPRRSSGRSSTGRPSITNRSVRSTR